MSCFVLLFSPSIALMAYWTCQFAFSWVCESPPCCERSYHYEQLTASRAVHRLNTSAEFAGIYFPREQKHSIQRRDSWCWMGLRTQKADAGAGAAPTCAGDQGPAWCAWTERGKCLLFRCEFQMGGRAIKSIRPELSLRVKARRLSDMHMCSAAHFWKHIHAILTLPPLLKLPS